MTIRVALDATRRSDQDLLAEQSVEDRACAKAHEEAHKLDVEGLVRLPCSGICCSATPSKEFAEQFDGL